MLRLSCVFPPVLKLDGEGVWDENRQRHIITVACGIWSGRDPDTSERHVAMVCGTIARVWANRIRVNRPDPSGDYAEKNWPSGIMRNIVGLSAVRSYAL